MNIRLALAAAAIALAVSPAQAHHHHHHRAHRRHHARHHRHMHSTFSRRSATVIGSRPAGCPHAFCGCEASLYLFGKIIPTLNLAANWLHFPRAAPAPHMAAARPGHVFVLLRQVAGDMWLVHDGNSGHHQTRIHVRSIRGFHIVNPHGAA